MDPMVLSKKHKSQSLSDDDDGVAVIHESWKKNPVHYLSRGANDGQTGQTHTV